MSPRSTVDVEAVYERLRATRKYGCITPALLHRVAVDASSRSTSHKAALGYARRKLHQAYGAFIAIPPADAIREFVQRLRDGAQIEDAARAGLQQHASTAERIPHLEAIYDRIAAWCGPMSSIVDLGCGLNALAFPWMHMDPGATYTCCDIDVDLVTALGELDTVLSADFKDVRAPRIVPSTCDLIDAPSVDQADVTLALKVLPTLEHQRRGAAQHLLASLHSEHVIVSYAGRSLSGRKGYRPSGAGLPDVVGETEFAISDTAQFGSETLFHLVSGVEQARRPDRPADA